MNHIAKVIRIIQSIVDHEKLNPTMVLLEGFGSIFIHQEMYSSSQASTPFYFSDRIIKEFE